MKKFCYIPLALLLMTGCAKNEKTPEQTTLPPEVTTATSLTLTEAATKETKPAPPPEQEHKKIILAVFDPFADSVRVDENLWDELSEALDECTRAVMISNGQYEYTQMPDFCDENDFIEENTEDDYMYCPVNEEYAKDEDELYNKLRVRFTDDYISDKDLYERLFGENENEGARFAAPNYKTVDGKLYVKSQYDGVPSCSHARLLAVEDFDGKRAKIMSSGNSLAYPPMYRIRMEFVRDINGSWKLDKMDPPMDYYDKEICVLYNVLYLKQDTLNAILGGGNTPPNARVIEHNGEEYAETDLDMSTADMYVFFEENFSKRTNVPKFSDKKETLLREAYIAKYIDEVYTELDGVLYRKVSAPRRYMPAMKMDPYAQFVQGGFGSEYCHFILKQPFIDKDGKEFTYEISIMYKPTDGDYMSDTCEYMYIADELPIREMT